ncbi:hypothetical protein RNAN_3650 [Rheinheimera nanhaiensis E407-8]|uniref:Uncharacterized protein n=1 Tax=Rheinheimera nanhaiensis E407-8 TaxID=562729 RepID=I1E2U6_9GAMM|nr:hypothetical protein RNAN_3650 [Rheinheimera nanhaiensis E407-8]
MHHAWPGAGSKPVTLTTAGSIVVFLLHYRVNPAQASAISVICF